MRRSPRARHRHPLTGASLAEHVASDATVYADEAARWDALHGRPPEVGRIDHAEACTTEEGNTDQAESSSLLRRMVDGQHHHVSPRHRCQYAAEAAWKEDNRRLSDCDAVRRMLRLAMAAPVSRQWKGCWGRSEV